MPAHCNAVYSQLITIKMKKKFIALAIAGSLISVLSHAQIGKGSFLFGGSIGYSTGTSSNIPARDWQYETKRSSIQLSPSFAYAVSDNFFLGADLSFSQYREKYDIATPGAVTSFKNNSYGGGIFARRYWEVANRLYIFGQGRIGYLSIKNNLPPYDINTSSTKIKGYVLDASIYPGLSFALSEKVHIESAFFNLLTVAYSKRDYSYYNNTPAESMKTLNVSSSFDNATSLTLGVKILLSK